MRSKGLAVLAVIVTVIAAASACGVTAGADDPANRRLRMMIPNSPGGGYDLTGRGDAKLMEDGDLLFRALVARREAVHDLLVATSQLSKQLTGLVQDTRADLKPALDNLKSVVDLLNRNSENIDNSLRLLAPFLPYVTEEVWSWWQEGSVHRATWPAADDLAALTDTYPAMLDAVAQALAGLRGVKSQAKVSQRTEVASAQVAGVRRLLDLTDQARADLSAAAKIVGELSFVEADGGDALSVTAELVPPAPTE